MRKQVDVIALSRIEESVALELVNLQSLYGDVPPDPEYWETVVRLAGRLFQAGGVDEGVRVLALIPPSYVRSEMVAQMESDEEFADLARLIADALIENRRVKMPIYHNDRKKFILPRRFGEA